MADAVDVTKQGDLIIPEVFAGAIQKKLGKFKLLNIATINTTDKVKGNYTIAKQNSLTEAVVVGEGEQVPFEKLKQTKEVVPFDKYAKGTVVTDEADVNSLEDPIEASAQEISNSLNKALENLVYSTMTGTKVKTQVTGLSKHSILEAFKSFGTVDDEDTKKNWVVVSKNNYFELQQNFKSTDDSGLHTNIAGTEIFKAGRVKDDEFYIVQEDAIQVRYSKAPSVVKDYDIDHLQTKVVGSTIMGAWRADDTKVIHVTILPDILDIDEEI